MTILACSNLHHVKTQYKQQSAESIMCNPILVPKGSPCNQQTQLTGEHVEYQQNNTKKERICFKFLNKCGGCRYGNRCYEAHVLVDPFKFVHEQKQTKKLQILYEGI